MSNRRYIIGTGYVDTPSNLNISRRDVMHHWVSNNQRYASPRAVFVLSMHGFSFDHSGIKEINVLGNLGHFSDLLNGHKRHAFSGAAGAILTLAMVAYCDESDFIYKEQDSLCFGPWVDRLYDEMGDGFGIKGPNDPSPSGTSLMLMRHESIPLIVSNYLRSRPEHDGSSLVEHHFDEMEINGSFFKHYTFGYDKRRPYDMDDEVFLIQQPNQNDIEELTKKGLI